MSENKFEKIQYPEIATKLKSMRDDDQTMRAKNLENPEEWDEVLDKKNTDDLKQIIEEIGWPTITKVGVDGANHAWILAQHADHDPNFQGHCLEMLKQLPDGEIEKWNIAYLEDRVRINRKRPQLYGTQFYDDPSGKYGPREIENPEELDKR